MSIYYPAGVSAKDFDDEPDPLADKPMGRCPWDGAILGEQESDGYRPCPGNVLLCGWDADESEDQNRARYAKEFEQRRPR